MKGVTPSPHETSTPISIGNLILLSKIQDKVTVALLEVDHDIFLPNISLHTKLCRISFDIDCVIEKGELNDYFVHDPLYLRKMEHIKLNYTCFVSAA